MNSVLQRYKTVFIIHCCHVKSTALFQKTKHRKNVKFEDHFGDKMVLLTSVRAQMNLRGEGGFTEQEFYRLKNLVRRVKLELLNVEENEDIERPLQSVSSPSVLDLLAQLRTVLSNMTDAVGKYRFTDAELMCQSLVTIPTFTISLFGVFPEKSMNHKCIPFNDGTTKLPRMLRFVVLLLGNALSEHNQKALKTDYSSVTLRD
ncbi:hypothetical protein F2P81_007567 [Scophthalmus maximus]|uniref:Uncharacterized protein n=1 Tax=Scophthalmus maximus TaxID=52904 RepID=A0A6A4TAY3_SCOMX|nr:hypothetical protein F2P81_007567 [Scophthalmus maximus]